MEDSSNRRVEKTLNVPANDEEKEVLEDSEVSKADVEFVTDNVAGRNSESVNETPGGEEDSSSSSSTSDEEVEEHEESSPDMEHSETFEEEKVVPESVAQSVELELGVSLTEELTQEIEPSFEKSGDFDVVELDAKQKEENISSSLDDTNADDLLITGLDKETEQLASAETTGDSQLSSDVESKGIDKETTLPDLDETNGSTVDPVPTAPVDHGITEPKIPVSDNNAGGSSGLASKENVEDSLQAANFSVSWTRDAGKVVNEPGIHESTENQPIISLRHRPVEPTSWKSCCGLLEVLRRSDR